MNKPITIISADELRSMLLRQTDSAMVSMVCATAPDMKAKNGDGLANPYRIGRGDNAVSTVCKVNKVNGSIAGRYERIVENRLAKEINAERIANGEEALTGDALELEILTRFRKGESWHRPIVVGGEVSCLSVNKKVPEGAEDNAETYLRFIFKAKGEAEYLDIATASEVTSEEIGPFLKPATSYANQGLEGDVVMFVCYSLPSIVEIAINGERYRISDNLQAYPIETRKRLWNIAEEYLSGAKVMAKV